MPLSGGMLPTVWSVVCIQGFTVKIGTQRNSHIEMLMPSRTFVPLDQAEGAKA